MGTKAEQQPLGESSGKRPGVPAQPSGALFDREDRHLAMALAAAALALYATTVCRTLYWGDSAEFAVVCPLLDITHATGYPLFTLLGKLATILPFGELAFRINLLGTFASTLAVALLFLLARAAGVDRLGAFFAAALFAASKELWEQATAAEVYSLHAALTGGAMLAAFAFGRQPDGRRLAIALGALGLAFTNHLTTLWTIPAMAWLIGMAWRPWEAKPTWRASRRDLGWAAIAFAAMLSLYLYLPIRSWSGVLFDHGETGSLRGLVDHVTGRQFRYRMFVQPDTGIAKEIGDFSEKLGAQFSPFLLLLAPIGVLALWRRDRRALIALALLAGANLAFDLNYHIPDKDGYFLPVYMALAILIGAGLSDLMTLLPPAWRALGMPWALAGVLILLPVSSNWAKVDKSGNRSLPEFTDQLLKRLPKGSLLMVDDQFLVWSVAYAQLLQGQHLDRIVVNDYLLCLPWYIHHLRRRYPELALPARVDALVAERMKEVERAKGWEIGDISQRYTERIGKAIVEANFGLRRVFYNFHDFEEHKSWQGFELSNRGLFFEIVPPGRPATTAPWAFDYPDPAGYRKAELMDSHHRHVSGTYSTASNRAGIALIGAGRHAEAEKAFEQALGYDPDYAQVHLNMGVLFHGHLPNRTKRDLHWKRFLELTPGDPQAATIKAAMAE